MQVRARTAAALANVSNRVTSTHHLSGSNCKSGKVTVERADSVAVIDHNCAAVAVHENCKANNAIRWSYHARADIAGDIHAAMERSFTAERVNALAKRSC